LAAIAGSLQAALTAADLHHEHLLELQESSDEKLSQSEALILKKSRLSHWKMADGSFLASSLSLHASATAPDLHQEQALLVWQVFSDDPSHELALTGLDGRFVHWKTAGGSLAAIAGSLQAALTAADLHHEHLLELQESSDEKLSQSEALSLKKSRLSHWKTADGSFLAISLFLQAAGTAADLHQEQVESPWHEVSVILSHLSSITGWDGRLVHWKTAGGSLAAIAGFLQAALTAADLHQEHLLVLQVSSESKLSQSAVLTLKKSRLSHWKMADGSFLASSLSLHASATAPDLHQEQALLEWQVFSDDPSHELSLSLKKSILSHWKIADGSFLAISGSLHAAGTAADLHHEHLEEWHWFSERPSHLLSTRRFLPWKSESIADPSGMFFMRDCMTMLFICFISCPMTIKRIAISTEKPQVFFIMDLVNPAFLDFETQAPHFPTAIILQAKKKTMAQVVFMVS